jgi:hypothetical protein
MRTPKILRARRGRRSGQALTEFVLVIPIFLLVLFSLIILGLFVFYQQQLNAAAREAARFAAVHSSSAQCPTASWMAPGVLAPPPTSYWPCDPPPTWPGMTATGRGSIWAVNPSAVAFRACWSGYRSPSGNPDAPQVNADGSLNQIQQCTIAGRDPTVNLGAMPCTGTTPALGNTTSSDDTGSDNPDNQVTVYACFDWAPPMAGFIFIPSSVTMRAAVTEVIHQQQ